MKKIINWIVSFFYRLFGFEQKSGTKLTVNLIDKSGNYEEVNIEVLSIGFSIDSVWYDHNIINPGIYNLLDLVNGNTLMLLRDADVKKGFMSEIRLKLGENNTVKDNGKIYKLKTPSGQSSGYKIKIHQELEEGISYQIIIDFNVEKSIVKTGNDKYLLKPVVHAHLIDAIGNISGIIEPIGSAYHVKSYNASDEFGTYVDEKTGGFLLNSIAGVYEVEILANEGYEDAIISYVDVSAGHITDLGIIEMVVDTIE